MISVFKGQLKEIDGMPTGNINIADIKLPANESRERLAHQGSDDEDSLQEGDETRKEEGIYLSKMIEDVEKSLRVPSQANSKLTDLKGQAQQLSRSKGNVFRDDPSVIVYFLYSALQHRELHQRDSSSCGKPGQHPRPHRRDPVPLYQHYSRRHFFVISDFGLTCYDTVSYLAKKNRSLCRKVLYSLKGHCVKSFYVEHISNLNHRYLERFLTVVVDNNMETIIDKDAYSYIKKWLKYIHEEKFQSPEINTEIIKQIFRLIEVLAGNRTVAFNKYIIEELAENMFRKARKIKENLGETFSVITEYVCRALTKYAKRETQDNLKVATILYPHNESPFMEELVAEIKVVGSLARK